MRWTQVPRQFFWVNKKARKSITNHHWTHLLAFLYKSVFLSLYTPSFLFLWTIVLWPIFKNALPFLFLRSYWVETSSTDMGVG